MTAKTKSHVCSKNQKSCSVKKCFHVLFHFKISNEVPTTIPQTYMSLSLHIRKGVLIRRNIASDCASNFEKNRENFKGELCLNVIIPFSFIGCCLVIA